MKKLKKCGSMPNWFGKSKFVIKNQKSSFVENLIKLITFIHIEMGLKDGKKSDPIPVNKKPAYFSKLESLYKKTLKDSQVFTGDDYEKAKDILSKFKANFGNHMPFLKTA